MHDPTPATIAAAIVRLDAIDVRDIDAAHREADEVLLTMVPEAVADAYVQVAADCAWWGCRMSDPFAPESLHDMQARVAHESAEARRKFAAVQKVTSEYPECPKCEGSGLIDDCPPWCSNTDHAGVCPECGGAGTPKQRPASEDAGR